MHSRRWHSRCRQHRWWHCRSSSGDSGGNSCSSWRHSCCSRWRRFARFGHERNCWLLIAFVAVTPMTFTAVLLERRREVRASPRTHHTCLRAIHHERADADGARVVQWRSRGAVWGSRLGQQWRRESRCLPSSARTSRAAPNDPSNFAKRPFH